MLTPVSSPACRGACQRVQVRVNWAARKPVLGLVPPETTLQIREQSEEVQEGGRTSLDSYPCQVWG